MLTTLAVSVEGQTSCQHTPPCEPWDSPGHSTARIIAEHHEQGWCLLCNGVKEFDDGGEILPNGTVVAAHRAEAPHRLVIAS